MATWVTHLMIADIILEQYPQLDRRGFCVGSVAPDCNIENEDWTAFMPPREVTHWMSGRKKTFADCDRFLNEYLLPRIRRCQPEEYAFLLGYWAHLIADAEFQRYIRDEDRVRASWERLRANAEYSQRAEGMGETWDSMKILFPAKERMQEISAIELDYLDQHPDSGYLTEILPLTDFPDYIDYFLPGSIVRKIGKMRKPYVPENASLRFIAMSREEYAIYVRNASKLVSDGLKAHHLIP